MDGNTLFPAFLCLSYLACLLLPVLLALSGRRFRGAGLWIATQVLNTVGPFVDLASGRPEGTLAANTLYLAACPLYFHGIWALRFPSPFPRWLYLWIPLELFSFVFLSGASELTRTSVFSLWLAAGTLACGGLLLWKPRKPRLLLGVGLGSVARLVLDGLPSKESAGRLFISPGTVKTHLQRLFRKTGCMNRAELVRTLLVGRKVPENQQKVLPFS